MECPECGEMFELSKPDGEDGMAPWFLDVYHDHEAERPHWVAVVYQHAKGQRYPKELKAIVQSRKDQRARLLQEKRNPGRAAVPTCPLHPRGCPDAN